MRYALLLLLLFVSCRGSHITNNHGTEAMVIAMDSLDLTMVPDLKDHGVTVTRLSATHAMVSYPKSSHGKIKLKNVGNDYSKVKDKSTVKESLTVKDKSKAKPKADIIGDGNTQVKPQSSKLDWVKWLSLAIIVLVLGYVFGPIIRNFLKR